jgi:hypothetical protein
VTALLAVFFLLSVDAGPPGAPDGGVRAVAPSRSAEDEEVIRNLDLLEHLAESQALEMLLEIDSDRSQPDR